MTKQICANCRYWKKDWGMFTVTGWTGACHNDGYCHLEPRQIYKSGDSFCQYFKAREADSKPN